MVRRILEPRWFRPTAQCTLLSFALWFLLPIGLSKAVRILLYAFLYAHFGVHVSDLDNARFSKEDPTLLSLGGAEVIETQLGNFLTIAAWDIPGLLFLAHCGMIFLLSTYHSSKTCDMRTPLGFHFKLRHRYTTDYSEHREKQYWKRIDSSVQARCFLEVFWTLRIGLIFLALYLLGQYAAIPLLLYHVLTLIIAALPPKEPAHSAILIWIHLAIGGILTFSNEQYLRISIIHFVYNCLVRLKVCNARDTWDMSMNGFPCTLCENEDRDIEISPLDETVKVLGRFQEDMCRHCWEPWLEGQYVATLGCGHVYHERCCKEWFRTGGRRDCPMCRFHVSRRDYERATKRRRQYTYEEAQQMMKALGPLAMWDDEHGIYDSGNWWELW